jgi:hypothetical protein
MSVWLYLSLSHLASKPKSFLRRIYHLKPLSLYHIFLRYLIRSTIFGEKNY